MLKARSALYDWRSCNERNRLDRVRNGKHQRSCVPAIWLASNPIPLAVLCRRVDDGAFSIMVSRREFKRTIKIEIVRRATWSDGHVLRDQYCEKCREPTKGRFEIDHRDPDAMQIDKGKPLTADDGWLLCIPCHKEKTKKDKGDIAKAKRREAVHLGARRERQQIKSDADALKSRHRPKHEGRTSLPPRPMFEPMRKAAE